MSGLGRLADDLDFYDPAFIDDPYPVLGRLREAAPVFRNERTGHWMLTRFADVHETLRGGAGPPPGVRHPGPHRTAAGDLMMALSLSERDVDWATRARTGRGGAVAPMDEADGASCPGPGSRPT